MLRVEYMTREYGRRLALSGKALIVSRVSIGEDADLVAQTHFHRLEMPSASGPRSVKIAILGAHNRSIVIPFEHHAVKDRALEHLQQARFDFKDEQDVKLNVAQLSEEMGETTNFVLGSKPLKTLGRLDDALRPFFTNVGKVLTKDIIEYPLHGTLSTTKVIISHAACPEWLQKTTATRDGPRDQQLRLEWVATCKFCSQIGRSDALRTRPGTSNSVTDMNTPNLKVKS